MGNWLIDTKFRRYFGDEFGLEKIADQMQINSQEDVHTLDIVVDEFQSFKWIFQSATNIQKNRRVR